MNILLETKNFSVKIAQQVICHDLNLQIKPGETWGILGPNGSGKTTLLHALANLHPRLHGDILLKNKNILALSSKEIATQIGILFQTTQDTFPQSVFEYCLQGRYPHLSYFGWENKEDHDIAREALTIMALDNKLTQSIQTLSGGERRRLSIAQLLTQAPFIYVLDEPINHLDMDYQIKILNHFKTLTLQHHKSVILSLHDINLAYHYCDQIIMLWGDGTILQGTPDVVLTTENLSQLYQHPLQALCINRQPWWVPVLSTPVSTPQPNLI
jgi:iron complex transport system ATP-binding protein